MNFLRGAMLSAAMLAIATPTVALAQATATDAASAPADASHAPVGTGVPTWIEQKSTDAQSELAALESSLSMSREKADKLKAEIDAMKGDRDKQAAALIAATERLKTAEADVAAVQDKIGDLIVQELDTRGRLDGADASISNVLAALERISRDPPPAIIVDPSDALGSARGALLIQSILPQLQAKAEKVLADLRHLGDIKAAAQAEEDLLKANFDVLEEEQLRIATLITARKQTELSASDALTLAEKQAADMADKAAALKLKIADLGRQANAVATAAQATEQAANGGNTPKLDSDTIRMALANPERTQPAVPFSAARGYLDMPVSGVSVAGFGDSDGFGGVAKGVSIVTRAEAPVLAPADGFVLFKGPFLNYGQILVLDAGQDYTILLAGLGAVDVTEGQFVRMGDKVGTMGSRTIGRAVASAAGASRPTLYIEMRNKSTPIDPSGWWASPDKPTESG